MSCTHYCVWCPMKLICKDVCDSSESNTTSTEVEKIVTLRPYFGTIYRQPAYQCEITDQLIEKQWLYGFGDSAFDHKVYLSHNRHNQFTLYHGWDVPVALLNVDENNVLLDVEIQTGHNPIQREGISLLKKYIGYKFNLPA